MKYCFIFKRFILLIFIGIVTVAIGQGIPGYPCYRTVEETFTSAQDIVTNYPELAQWIDIGDSWEKTEIGEEQGYDIFVLRLTNSAIITGNPKPKLIVVSGLKPREYSPPELALRFAEYLVENYEKDADVTWILDYHEIHFILHTNPDGRKKAEQGLAWIKNTNKNYCSPTSNYRGANLNRNFVFQWGCCGGSSGNECDVVYRGSAAASEPETQAIQNYLQLILRDMKHDDHSIAASDSTPGILLHLQSYSEKVMWPWGFTTTPAPNNSALQTLGRKLAFFNGYSPQQEVEQFPTDGTLTDFSYGDLGVATISILLGTSYFQDCATFENTILQNNFNLIIEAAKMVRTPYLTASGPSVININIGEQKSETIQISATINDTMYNNTNGIEPTQHITTAEYYIDVPPWVSVPIPIAFNMNASDGIFDSRVEDVSAMIDISGYSLGRHTVFLRGQDADGNWGNFSAIFIEINQFTGIDDPHSQSGYQYPEVHIHPVPSQIITNIELQVESSTRISIEIYDILGRKVRSLSNRVFSAGSHDLVWDSRDQSGSLVTSGVYFLRLSTMRKVKNYKIIKIK